MPTIFALSSGAPPAAIAIIRISGPAAATALETLAGRLPEPRRAVRAKLRNSDGEVLDDGLALWFPGPVSATGEDLAELHIHGGRAVIAAVEFALGEIPGFRRAEPGEFTRRAFANGRIDLAEAEGLADLLIAETELQRRAAMAIAGGLLSRRIETWRERVLALSAEVEAALDFDEEDEVVEPPKRFFRDVATMREEIDDALAAPSAEVLREGYRVALAGPPNAGKSTLFNALVASEAAITSPLAGTTRDVIERPVAIAGLPFTFVDMAGLRIRSSDTIEAIGIERAQAEIDRADLVLWLGSEGLGPPHAWEIEAQCDRANRRSKRAPRFTVSAVTGQGMSELTEGLLAYAHGAMPKSGEVALNARQTACLKAGSAALGDVCAGCDLLVIAEALRATRASFDALLGRTSTEDVLDALFSRFCIGK